MNIRTLSLSFGILVLAASVQAAEPLPDHGISGLWMVINPQQLPENLPLTEEAKALMDIDERMVADGLSIGERSAKCLPVATPAMMVNEFALNIVEGPGQVVISSENNSLPRLIYLDGRDHTHAEGGDYGWNGHSTGKWNANILEVDTVGFNDKYAVYKGATLAPHRTAALHLTERFWVEDGGEVLVDEMTYNDPGTFTQPVVNTVRYRRLKSPDHFIEYSCEVQLDAIAKNAAWRKAHGVPAK